ncbi:MAG: hypothetical protein WC655_24265, partial [Candidatus Hydrogenedentales bacterium]
MLSRAAGAGWKPALRFGKAAAFWAAACASTCICLSLFAMPIAVAETVVFADKPNPVEFAPQQARFVRFVVKSSNDGAQPCIDELEVYGADAARNLALASQGAKATASSCLSGYAAHQVAHLNDGMYGNDHSWITATANEEWAQIELPEAAEI